MSEVVCKSKSSGGANLGQDFVQGRLLLPLGGCKNLLQDPGGLAKIFQVHLGNFWVHKQGELGPLLPASAGGDPYICIWMEIKADPHPEPQASN